MLRLTPDQLRRLLAGVVNAPGVQGTSSLLLKALRNSPIPQSINKANRLKRRTQGGFRAFKKYTHEMHPLDTGVTLRKEFFINPATGRATPNMYFGNFRRTPMMDIDVRKVPGRRGAHFDRNITYNTREDALRAIDKYAMSPLGRMQNLSIALRASSLRAIDKYAMSPLGRMQNLRVYNTPGGLRIIDMKNRVTPINYFGPNYGMPGGVIKTDPDYITRRLYPGGAFDYRISPKPGRKNDYVANVVEKFGKGKANPRSEYEVETYHDALIAEVLNNPGNTLGGLFKLLKG